MGKPRIIIFGAGERGRKAAVLLQKEYEVAAFCDNDPQKIGSVIGGLPIISPWSLSDECYSFVVIASTFAGEILNQLRTELGVADGQIKIASSTQSKGYSFEHPSTLELARAILISICRLFNESGVRYFLDGGTLLGVVRTGDLLPWDNDIDISVMSEDLELIEGLLQKEMGAVEEEAGCQLQLTCLRQCNTVGPWSENDIRRLRLSSVRTMEDPRIIELDLIARYPLAGNRVYVGASNLFSDSESYFIEASWLEFFGCRVSVPGKYEQFLSDLYGEWRVVRRDWSYGKYANIVKTNIVQGNRSNSRVMTPPDVGVAVINGVWCRENNYILSQLDEARYSSILASLLEHGVDFDSCVDVGHGDGRITQVIARYVDYVTAVEFSGILSEQAQAAWRGGGVNNIVALVVGSPAEIECRSVGLCNCVDVVSLAVSDEDFVEIMSAFRNLLRSGGVLMLADMFSTFPAGEVSEHLGPARRFRSAREFEAEVMGFDFQLLSRDVIAEASALEMGREYLFYCFVSN